MLPTGHSVFRRRREAGFTLAELVMVAAVLVMVASALTSAPDTVPSVMTIESAVAV